MNPAVLAGFGCAPIVYLVVLGLHLVVPARVVDGYVRDEVTGRPLRYRLNGLRVFIAVLALAALAVRAGFVSAEVLWTHRWASLAGAVVTGLVFTVAVVAGAPATGKGIIADAYLGRRPNPRWGDGRVDAKMFLYLAGAVMLQLNLLSFAAHHWHRHADAPSPGVDLYVGLFSFFLTEYLYFEEVHLYTYDFVAERVGFKLGWGCLAFYPYFYAVGLWGEADAPDPGTPAPLLALCALTFFGGWALSRGANLQKFLFKTRPDAKLFGVLAPVTVSDDRHQLLCSGFWALSRHINYLGEIMMALGLCLSLGRPWSVWPWLYPLYYFALLLPRQADDDRRCAQKYGPLWDEYRRRVPWRIIPKLY
jgi:hypothetical protein